MSTLGRRVRRGSTLLCQWLVYLVTTRPIRTAVLDLSRWARTTFLGSSLTTLDLPWLCFPATRFLDRQLEAGWRVLEWGSGASTLFFTRRGCRVTSVEHNPTWAEKIGAQLDGFPEAELLLVPETESAYVTVVDQFPAASLDLVVVDGRRRCACLERALSRVRPGGWLVLDDSDRQAYRPCLDALPERDWEALHFHGPRPSAIWPVFGRTTCLRRRRVEETTP